MQIHQTHIRNKFHNAKEQKPHKGYKAQSEDPIRVRVLGSLSGPGSSLCAAVCSFAWGTYNWGWGSKNIKKDVTIHFHKPMKQKYRT